MIEHQSPDWDFSPPSTAPYQPHSKPPSRMAPKKRHGCLGRLIFGCVVLIALSVGLYAAINLFAGRAPFPFLEPEPITFPYRDRILQAIEGVPINQYDPEGYFTDERGRIGYTQNGLSAKAGIDVSFYQGQVDWTAVAGDGVEFVMIRLGYRGYTEGSLQMDSRFYENIQGALDAGLEVGVYFFSQAITPQEAVEEAQFVLDVIGDYPISYPVAFDWEFITPGKEARTDAMDGATLTACAAAFCDTIAQGGYTPIVYFNQDLGYLTLDLGQLAQYPFWLADYDAAPDFFYHFDLWQYSHSGTVAGIQGSVDWNLDYRQLNQSLVDLKK